MTKDKGQPVGYCIGHDQYFKRDDVGIIYQMNVSPGRQRSFVGATLLQAMFERAAYGCRLFCCWCAQDIAANRFWEAMGFVPLAYRAGSEKKSRVHIFWQKRIRSDDTTTPWWFPAKTDAGAMREDRLVLPIPPGTHWSEAKPILLPGARESAGSKELSDEGQSDGRKALPGPRARKPAKPAVMTTPPGPRKLGGWGAAPPPPPQPAAVKPVRAERAARPRVKVDPRLVAAARELRDRYLEQLNRDGGQITANAKYDVGRGQPAGLAGDARPTPLLIDAARAA